MLGMLLMMVDTPEEKRLVEQLYEKYNKLVYAVAYNILRNPEDAEDAAVMSWEKIIKNLEKINKVDCKETKSFIVIISERTAIDCYRANKRRVDMEKKLEQWEQSPYFATLDRQMEEWETLLWLKTLPKNYGEVLILYYVNEMSIKEIANYLGIMEVSVHSRLNRARNYLKREYEEGGYKE